MSALLKAPVTGVVAASASRSRRALAVRAQATDTAPGAKLEKWFKTPFDILAFGPRAGFGALVSLPEKLQTLQTDVEKLTELVQDPRPLDVKQQIVMQEVEDTLVEFLEKGVTLESDIISNIKPLLPPEVAQQLEEIIPEAPTASKAVEAEVLDEQQQPVVYTAVNVAPNQVAGELSEIRDAVVDLKTNLAAFRNNTDTSASGMLRLNLREARDRLARRLQEVGGATSNSADSSVAAAIREANLLLGEVDGQFFS